MARRFRNQIEQRLWAVEEEAAVPTPRPRTRSSRNDEELRRALDELLLPLTDLGSVASSPLEIDLGAAVTASALQLSLGEALLAPGPAVVRRLVARLGGGAGDALVAFLAEQAATGFAGYHEGLGALAAYGGPLAQRAGAALATLNLVPGPVDRVAGRVTITATHLVRYLTGDAFELVFELRYPHTADRPAYVLTFTTFDGPCLATAELFDDSQALLTELGDHPTLVEVDAVPTADALNTLHHVLSVQDLTAAEPELPDVVLQRPLIEHLLASQPRSGVVFDARSETSGPERQRITAELTDWIGSSQPSLAAAAAHFAPFAVDFAADRAGNPYRWTTNVSLQFLEHAGEALAGQPALDLRTVPDLVRLTIGWARTNNGWPTEITDDAMDAVDLVEQMYLDELDSDETETEPETALSLLDDLFASIGLDDLDSLSPLRQYASRIVLGASTGSALEPPVGGRHPEPFDPAGIPPHLTARAQAIAETASRLAAGVFDDEYVTVTRRFVADIARHPVSPLGRGKPDIWASGVIYAVAQFNDIPGGWTPLSLPGEGLTEHLPGAHSTILAKARDLRLLAGLHWGAVAPRYRHSTALIDGTALLGGLERFGAEPHDGPSQPAGAELDGIDHGCFVLQVSLLHIRPRIWRRVRVPVDATFAQLHQLLQLTFGWYDCHLHSFDIDGFTIGPAGPDLDDDAVEDEMLLSDVLRPGSELIYTYDFGDSWEHLIVVEELVVGGPELDGGPWALLGGQMAGPPEDCGGPMVYAELLSATRGKGRRGRPADAERLPPGFDPKRFDAAIMNQAVHDHDWSAPYRASIW